MKKLSVFLSKELETNLAESQQWAEAYRVALLFLAEVAIYGSSKFDGGPWRNVASPRHGGDGGGYAKWYCDCHSESKSTKELFEEAHRVECHLSLYPSGAGPLKLELKAYKRGVKEPHKMEMWHFPRENAQNRVLNPNAA